MFVVFSFWAIRGNETTNSKFSFWGLILPKWDTLDLYSMHQRAFWAIRGNETAKFKISILRTDFTEMRLFRPVFYASESLLSDSRKWNRKNQNFRFEDWSQSETCEKTIIYCHSYNACGLVYLKNQESIP